MAFPKAMRPASPSSLTPVPGSNAGTRTCSAPPLLNAQPLGFYAPAQIVRDARDHGVEVRPIDINKSRWDCTLEPKPDEAFAIRLGLRLVRNLANRDAATILTTRGDGAFQSIDDVWRRSGVGGNALTQLAKADAFLPSLGLARREALWAIKGLRDEPLPLFAAAPEEQGKAVPELTEPTVSLKPLTAAGEVVEDYRHIGLTLRRHPVFFMREALTQRGILPCRDATSAKDGKWVETAGLVLVRQKPGSAKGVMFITIEDETGVANVVIWPSLYEQQRRIILMAGMFAVRGRIQREGEVVHLVAHKLTDLSDELTAIGRTEVGFPLPHGRGDEAHYSGHGPDPREVPPKGLRTRDIYVPDQHIDTLRVKTRDFR